MSDDKGNPNIAANVKVCLKDGCKASIGREHKFCPKHRG
ncbi:hypothetical protein HJTV-2_gp54 [Haloarcula virus HJTV-2]|uniref:Uncharacterized protein n=2 Tax=Haloferacalesvirus TaxID=2843389 RepID=A0AAE8XX39_9CAUD|nr:hypothetical protein M1M33_gp093 [Haloarcula virus HJTV-2]UBF21291.1 hypothetical protein HRTV-13_gp45 [Halorubrum phage HRTV-13]UBF21411.1 hypothetical protein HRTV-21_gp45 [Halorubrum virus HRTV-21]UBF21534.1 hypothetical protein HRTV-24_gp48 [Halorubrum virus HRTV-24]UBF21674.1 hypothetical protein HJTV-2_gp54 [Haloarcula virus HJTV-2]